MPCGSCRVRASRTPSRDSTPTSGAAGRPTPDRALELRRLLTRFVTVCEVVAYAHSRGVIHRDIKPSNILLGPYGETLVVDWGLAKSIGRRAVSRRGGRAPERPPEPARGSSATVAGTVIGTPAYMSPEQAEGSVDAMGPASDVYSLGATLYHLLVGRPPFGDADPEAVLAQREARRADAAPLGRSDDRAVARCRLPQGHGLATRGSLSIGRRPRRRHRAMAGR